MLPPEFIKAIPRGYTPRAAKQIGNWCRPTSTISPLPVHNCPGDPESNRNLGHEIPEKEKPDNAPASVLVMPNSLVRAGIVTPILMRCPKTIVYIIKMISKTKRRYRVILYRIQLNISFSCQNRFRIEALQKCTYNQ